MASGVAINNEVKISFQDFKIGHKYRYIIYCLSEDFKEIIVEKYGERNETYEDFVALLKAAEDKDQCRYGVFDAVFTTKDGQQRDKIVFFMWSPDKAKMKQKMVYASSKDALKKALGEGVAKEIQANDHGDLAWSNVLETLQSI
jgi:cofilin